MNIRFLALLALCFISSPSYSCDVEIENEDAIILKNLLSVTAKNPSDVQAYLKLMNERDQVFYSISNRVLDLGNDEAIRKYILFIFISYVSADVHLSEMISDNFKQIYSKRKDEVDEILLQLPFAKESFNNRKKKSMDSHIGRPEGTDKPT